MVLTGLQRKILTLEKDWLPIFWFYSLIPDLIEVFKLEEESWQEG